MKKIHLLFFFIFTFTFGQIGVNTLLPNGELEINSTNTGLIIPRIALISKNNVSPVLNPNGASLIDGTLIYNTAFAGIPPNDVFPGFYYWDATALTWNTVAGSSGINWSVEGNVGTSIATNFVGTRDAVDFITKTNNTENTRVTSGGNFGIGTNNPNGKLHAFEDTGTTLTSTEGSIIFEHDDNGGNSSILFKSRRNIGSDYGYFRYSDDGSGNGSSLENSLLEIGVQNDIFSNVNQDDIALMPSGYVGIGTTKPNALLHINGTIAFTTATNGINKTITLRNSGTFFTPVANVNSAGLIYIIRNTSTTGNITVNNIINFGTIVAANFILTPSVGNIMIICDGVNWYRI